MRMPSTGLVAGTLITPELQVHNTSRSDVSLSDGVSVVPDGQDQTHSGSQPDPRGFPMFPMSGPPGAFQTRVPAGETWSIPAMAQIPFDPSEPFHLHASAGLGIAASTIPIASPVVGLVSDIPLRLTVATPMDQLHLELKADHQQWCLRAQTQAAGGPVALSSFE